MASDGETSCANDPNFAVIYSFLKVFGKLYGLEVPTIAKLQEFIENTQEVSDSLRELHLRLLRRALKSIHSTRWEKGMIKFCHQQGHHQEAWEIERFSYKKASTQVKLKVLKLLLEYQFTCHPKFKTAVNAISCKELRLDPIGRDKNGCVYWLQVDNDANLCLYKEDQDEETWQLIARNRDELAKVIGMLKNGEEICATNTSNANEDSSGAENHIQESNSQPLKPDVDVDDNEEEFLSPESESEQEVETEQKEQSSDTIDSSDAKLDSAKAVHDNVDSNNEDIKSVKEPSDEIEEKSNVELSKDNSTVTHNSPENLNTTESSITEQNYEKVIEEKSKCILDKPEESSEGCEKSLDSIQETCPNELKSRTKDIERIEETDAKVPEIEKSNTESTTDKTLGSTNLLETIEVSKDSGSSSSLEKDLNITNTIDDKNNDVDNEVSEEIEEPVMLVTGEGNGADCESYFLGEEIIESVMYFYGEGYGYDNDTGNPDAIEEANEAASEEENGTEEFVNGEHEAIKSKAKTSKSVRLKPVNKRALKKPPNDTNDAKPDTKKPCVRDLDKSNNSNVDNDLTRESSVNDKSTTDSESPRKNNIKKGRSKVKKKAVVRKLKPNCAKEAINSLSETDNCQDKTSIIEKRKSSVSSVDEDEAASDRENDKSSTKDLKVEDPLPTKKLRLETTPESDVNATHSKDAASDGAENQEKVDDSISKRKVIKACKGKFKRKNFAQKKEVTDNHIDKINDSTPKKNKSLKRSLIEEPESDKNKTESQSESEVDEPVTSGKRLKIKPKKIITSSRKKVEAKLLEEKHSSDESEEETLYSLAGKKSTKKLVKKKPKVKSKDKKHKEGKANSEESDTAPVRQSRRIAQQKIKEEAERRHQEEVALRELKMIHKKKTKDDEDEDEWVASGGESSDRSARAKRVARRGWRSSDSTGPEDSDSDSPLFDLHHDQEPEPDYGKSDHEFSPESDLEGGEQEPLKRARTLQEEQEGYCKRCGSSEQPEWVLLCDSCDSGYHASCLKPMLFLIPEGDWFCPPCNHERLIKALESELVKYDELLARVEEERARKKLEQPEPTPEEEKKVKSDVESDGSSSSWSSSSGGAVYRLRARRQLPVSYRSQEYDRIISAAIKEEYVEPTTSAGNQGRGKDISTIIEAAEEEKLKAEREAIEQGKPVESIKRVKKKQRRKPRKLNSLDVPSEDDDETDEDFKDTGAASSSEEISSSADREGSSDSRSSDSLPIARRTGRNDKKDRPKLRESSPETKKKKKGVFAESSSESAGAKEWAADKPKHKSTTKIRTKRRDRSKRLTQYDAAGNVVRGRVTYGGLSGDENDWSPKHRTRQKKIDYTEIPNTESEDEMHKSSGKHMPDSSDEFKISESEYESDSDGEKSKRKKEEKLERERALSDLVRKTAVVPLEKLPDDVTKAKTEELQAHLNAQAANARPARGRGSRGGRGSRSGRGRGGSRARASSPQTDDALAKLVGVRIKELGQDGTPLKPNQIEREKKRQEREAKLAEKEAKRQERIQKREEKEKLKEQKAKEREEKRLARLAMQENKRVKKEKEYMGFGPLAAESPRPAPPGAERFPAQPRLQVRAELRGVLTGEHRQELRPQLREGTLSVAGSPQPFKPVSEEPSIITRMPHMINQQYSRGGMVYGAAGPAGAPAGYPAGSPAGYPRGYLPALGRYPAHYYRLPAPYPDTVYRPGAAGPAMGGGYYRGAAASPPGAPNPYMSRSPGPPTHQPPHYMSRSPGPPNPFMNRSPGPVPVTSASHPYANRSPGPVPVTSQAHHNPFLARSPGPSHHYMNRSPGPPNPRLMPPARMPGPPSGVAPNVTAPGPPGAAGPVTAPPAGSQDTEPPIKIKAEVKTEPEYRSPAGSPGSPREAEPPRHPKIKVTERRPRFPLGPYAPHLAPYRPYAPPPQDPAQISERAPRGYLPPGAPRPFPYHMAAPPQAGARPHLQPSHGHHGQLHNPPQHQSHPSHGQPGQPPHGQPGQSPHGQPGQSPHGQPSQPPHGQPGQSPHGQPGQSPHGQPGQPPHGQPGQSLHGQPGQSPHGQPGQAQHGQPGLPPHGQPGQPLHGQPGQPLHGQPGQPPHGQPGQPLHGQPGQPPHGQPGQPPLGQQGQPPLGQQGHSPLGQLRQSPHAYLGHSLHGAPPQSLHGLPGQSPHGPLGQPLHGLPGQSPHRPSGLPPHGPPPHGLPGQPPHGPSGQPPHGPAGQPTHGPPGQSPHGHPGQSPHGPPGQSAHGPPGQSQHGLPAQTPHGLPRQRAQGPPEQSPICPPGQSPHNPPGQSPHGSLRQSPRCQPGQSPHGHAGLSSHVPPGQSPHDQPGQSPHGPPRQSPHGLPGQSHAPPAQSPHGPHGQSPHGPPGQSHVPPAQSPHGPLGQSRGPPAHSAHVPLAQTPHLGLSTHRLPGQPPQRQPEQIHGHPGLPPHMAPGPPPQGQPPRGSFPLPPAQTSPHPPGLGSPHLPHQPHLPPPHTQPSAVPPYRPPLDPAHNQPAGAPLTEPILGPHNQTHGAHSQPPDRPAASPQAPSPQGPPGSVQGQPNSVQAPGPHEPTLRRDPSPLASRGPLPFPSSGPQVLPRREGSPQALQAIPGSESPPSLDRVKVEREEAGGVFGGLVSYFSSQHEDDMDN